MEHWIKFLCWWERNVESPVFDALYCDHVHILPKGVGFNAKLGHNLLKLGLSRNLDYRDHSHAIMSVLTETDEVDVSGRVLSAEGRSLWTELGPGCRSLGGLIHVMNCLTFEVSCVVVLLFADMLCCTSLKSPARTYRQCTMKFTT
jgi:hypothetical protein